MSGSPLYQEALAQLQAGRPAEAEASCQAYLREHPGNPAALTLLGAIQGQQGRFDLALKAFDEAIAAEPENPQTLSNRGLALKQLGRLAEALQSYEQAAALPGDKGDLLRRCYLLAMDMGRPDKALPHLQQLLGHESEATNAIQVYARQLLQTAGPGPTLPLLQEFLTRHPENPDANYLAGIALGQLGHHEQALAAFRRTLAQAPDHAEALMNLGGGLWLGGQYEEAAAILQRCQTIAPQLSLAHGYLFNARLRLWQWQDYEPQRQALEDGILAGQAMDTPFPFLAVSDNPAAQLRCGQLASLPWNTLPAVTRPPLESNPQRLRVGYLSSDFRTHPVSFLLAGVWEHHDRNRFEVHALSLNPPDTSPTGQRVRAAFEHFHDLGHLNDAEIAQTIARLGLHLIIDLMGHTQGSRPGILARRPAPLQINYLGFPGTSGMACLDYLIADPYLVPEDQVAHYSEKLLWLPECFQANDDRRQIAAAPHRQDLGLPPQGLVFCCFNNSYKINPPLFDIWCEMLHAAPGSVLWLYAPQAAARQHLLQEAEKRGIDAPRLIFAEALPYPEHLARLGQADLFLDTLPFNAGTTASDALWAGLPILTCAGHTLAGRMAGSLLHNLGLGDLVTPSLTAYRDLGLLMARHPDILQNLRQRIANGKTWSPVFDTRRFTRHLEAGLEAAWARHAQGQAPDHLRIPRQDDPAGANHWHNQGQQAMAQRQWGQGEQCLRKALSLQPGHLEAGNDLGIVFMKQNRFSDAATAFETALAHHPDHKVLLTNLATCQGVLGQQEAMIATYDRCLALDPDMPYVRGLRFNACLGIARWQGYAEEQAEILQRALTGSHRQEPLGFLAVSDNSAAQLRIAKTYCEEWLKLPPPPPRPRPPATAQLKVAYLSADFNPHPVSFLMAGVWEAHDKSRFETIAISVSPPDNSPLGVRVRAAFDQFHEVAHLSDQAVADLIRQLGVHILVDLAGHTRLARQGVMALRPAPLQVNFLGFQGTSGIAAMDYILADPFVIPPDLRPHYSEKVLYLPESCMPNDDTREVTAHCPSREALGLPEEGVVFCCFNNTYKLVPPIFDVWVDLLRQVPDSVLWLRQPEDQVQARLQAEAAARGVAPERLVFAPKLAKIEDHLARIAAADLFLDTPFYNACTTACDALWAGVPVLTCAGDAMVSRIAGSLLLNLGLPDLITTDLAAYRAQALKLALSKATRDALRQRLAQAREHSVLFKTGRFARHLEAAYETIWQRHTDGLPPDHTFIPNLSQARG